MPSYLIQKFLPEFILGTMLALLFPSPLTAKDKSPVEVFRGEWSSSRVKQLFETPLGSVYEFRASDPFVCQATQTPVGTPQKHGKNCRCANCRRAPSGINGILQCNFLKSSKKNKRFVVIDFKIRNFPAFHRHSTSEFRFQLTRSSKTKVENDYFDLNGLVDIRSDSPYHFSSTYRLGILERTWEKGSGNYYRPQYEPISFRMIFDTATGAHGMMCNMDQNAGVGLELPLRPGRNPIEIRNFGIISQKMSENEEYQTTYLEISDPVIYQFNSQEDFNLLPDIDFVAYPYGSYESFCRESTTERRYREILRTKNPDLQYAEALRLLYSSRNKCDPQKALNLLEKASREHHVFANYQLGVCYYRGYGVPIDLEKATRYLEKAEACGYLRATVLRAQIVWNSAHRPLFMSSTLRKELEGFFKKGAKRVNDTSFNVLNLILNPTGFASGIELSPKYLVSTQCATLFCKKDEHDSQGIKYYVDHAIELGHVPAWLYKAVQLGQLGGNEEQRLACLKAGSAAGDSECTSELLWDLARRGQLSAQDFSTNRDLLLADDVVYLFLKQVMTIPDFPGVAEFLCDDFLTAQQIWKTRNDATSNYLLGLAGWMLIYPVQFRHDGVIRYQNANFQADEHKFAGETAFQYLKRAAEAGIPAAQYLIGRQYLFEDLPESERVRRSVCEEQARYWLEKAVRGNFPIAYYRLAQLESYSDRPDNDRIDKLLKPLCERQYAPAVQLRADVLSRMNRKAEAEQLWLKAAQLGEHQAFYQLAKVAEANGQEETARKYWSEYIFADLQFRMADRYDDYWPEYEINQWQMEKKR